jgi:DNA-repair protein XRCC2
MRIFRPTSSDQLAVTLAHLPKYHAKHFPDTALGMVAIHSVDAFYWLDRFKAEQLRLTYSSMQNILSILETIRLSLGSVVVLTDWGLVQHRQAQYTYNPHSHEAQGSKPMDLPLVHQITLSVIDTNPDDPEYKHTLAVVKVHGRPESRKFTLKIRPDTLSVLAVE